VYSETIRIRWRDIDALGHVNNAVYLTYLEELLNHWLEPTLGDSWVTARSELDFRTELRLADGDVSGTVWPERLGTSSLTAGVRLKRRDGVTALEGRMVLVAWDPETRRPRKLTDPERAALTPETEAGGARESR
jgi:acyl-CoA thioester hydrolase